MAIADPVRPHHNESLQEPQLGLLIQLPVSPSSLMLKQPNVASRLGSSQSLSTDGCFNKIVTVCKFFNILNVLDVVWGSRVSGPLTRDLITYPQRFVWPSRPKYRVDDSHGSGSRDSPSLAYGGRFVTYPVVCSTGHIG